MNNLEVYIYNILEFNSWKERINFFLLNKYLYNIYCSDFLYWKWLCKCLIHDSNLYIPRVLPKGESWQRLFKEMWQYRNLWSNVEITDDAHRQDNKRFKISVYARFRPDLKIENSEKTEFNNEGDRSNITLPLHQKLKLVKIARNLKTNKMALKFLKNEGSWFGEKWDKINQESGKENISQNRTSKKESLKAGVQNIDSGTGQIIVVAPDIGLREFVFDAALPTSCSQEHVYEIAARRQVMDFLNGFNATLIVYGQTGSGKTYTMFGEESSSKKYDGVVPRACMEIFQAVNEKNEKKFLQVELYVSYIEIYGDQITDLLRNGTKCGHSKVAAQQFVLKGAAEKQVSNISDLIHALKIGDTQKRRAATAMNDRSTRAHSLFILTLKQNAITSEKSITSRLFFADLGGCEQVKKSKIEAGSLTVNEEFSTGFVLADRMREAVYINLGLLALKKCIEALNNKSKYVPFQDSKLTLLLSTGLGGNSKTSIIVCGNLDPSNASETMAALRFGERCALIETKAQNEASLLAGILDNLEKQIASLEEKIREKENWKVIDEKRKDELAEEGTLEANQGAIEIKKVTVLVGAEKERKDLEILLLEKLRLTGVADENTLNVLSGKSKYGSLGFGGQYAEQYGLGKAYDMNNEFENHNERFKETVPVESLPEVIRNKKNNQWVAISNEDTGINKVFNKKRNKLVYSGLSL